LPGVSRTRAAGDGLAKAKAARPSDRESGDRESGDLLRQAQRCSGARRTDLLNDVVERHLGLADALANRYWRSGQDHEDLVQIARAGLVEAARRFDPERGDFVAFAVPTITGVIKRHFRDHGWMIRPPRQTQELVLTVRRSWPSLAQEIGAEPTAKDLAARAGVHPDAIREAQMAGDGYRPAALSLTECVLPSIDAGAEFERCDAQAVIEPALRRLAPAERALLRMRFYERLTQQEIALLTGTNQMGVSRQLVRLLVKLREMLGSLEAA
jgi:RNA polymerase sigma-B factor